MKRFYSALFIALIFASVCFANEKSTKSIPYNPTYWTDLRFSATSHKQGANTKPVYDETNMGLIFPVNDETEISYINAQLPHEWKGTAISPHCHIAQATSATPVFAIAYRWYSIGDRPTASFTVITTNASAVTYVNGTYHQLLEFPDIEPTGISGVSSMLDIKLYRKTGDGGPATVLLKEFDIHYEQDFPGSRTEYVK